MDGFEDELLRRLPLGHAVYSLFAYVADEPFLEALFQEHRDRCYQGVLSFAGLTYLIRDALMIHEGSGRASFQHSADCGELPVLDRSVYPKLSRIPLALSKAFLRECSRRMLEVADRNAFAAPLPESLRAFRLIAFDGKTIKHVRRQLKALRPLRGALLGGKVVVALDVGGGLALAMDASEDGERNDAPLVPGVVAQVRSMIAAPKLWMGDRQFADLSLMTLLNKQEDHFLIRATRTLCFTPDPARPATMGTDRRGRRYEQQWGWIGAANNPRRRHVRRITLFRPEEKDDLILVSDLLDETLYPPEDLLEAYLLRWGIEQVFQQVTEVFNLRQLIGCTPRANLFQTAFCFVIYNLIQIIRAHVAQGGELSSQEVSTAKLFDDVQDELLTLNTLASPDRLRKLIPTPASSKQMRQRLCQLLRGVWKQRWRKTFGNPRNTKGRTQRAKGDRTSVYKVLRDYRARSSNERR